MDIVCEIIVKLVVSGYGSGTFTRYFVSERDALPAGRNSCWPPARRALSTTGPACRLRRCTRCEGTRAASLKHH